MSADRCCFSLIIPTYSRPEQLAGCLESLTHLHAPPGGFEVIVVDDGSPQPLEPVAAPFRQALQLTLLRQPNGGPALARNTGAAIACGRYLAFTDDDCRPEPDWLCALARRFEQTPQALLGGRTVNSLTRNACSAASQLIVDVVYAFFNQNPDAARFFASNNIAAPAAVFWQLNGFDGAGFRFASEDRDFCSRWREQGGQMVYVPEAVVRHAHRLTLRTFCRQHFSYGQGAWRYHGARARRGSGRMRDEVGFHAQLPRLLPGPLSKLPFRQIAPVLLLLVVWQVANAAGFFYEYCRSGVRP